MHASFWPVVTACLGSIVVGQADSENYFEYQRFIDHFPVTDPHMDKRNMKRFGETRHERIPGLLTRFDWCLGTAFGVADVKKNKDPRTIYANPGSVSGRRFLVNEILTIAATDFDQSHNNRTLVFGDSDKYFTELWPFDKDQAGRSEWLAKLRKYFNRILYEALDVHVDGVDVWPITLYEPYLRKSQSNAAAAIATANLDKPKTLLAAWGRVWPAIEEKGLHKEKIEMHSRRDARTWAESSAGQRAGVELRDIPEEEWWGELAKYRFLLSPTGLSIQTPKLVEALLVWTVPIVQRHRFPIVDRLADLGFPIVIVDSWDEITLDLLEASWTRLRPRLESFRLNCLTAAGYWNFVLGIQTADCWKQIAAPRAGNLRVESRLEI